MNRRQFVKTTAMVAAAASLEVPASRAADSAKGVSWPIGCFNRPWRDGGLDFDAALAGVKAAGYKITGLLTRSNDDPFIGSDATAEYLHALKGKIDASGLKVNMGALRTRAGIPAEDAIADVRKQIDHAHLLGLEFLLTFGVDRPSDYEIYYQVMHDAAGYALERQMKLVLKPHGGGSGAAEEITRCLAKVNHPNFKIWYDAGNIIYYTGKDPLEQLKPIVQHVTGFCAKDCDKLKGNVWLEFGTGKVDFAAVFGELKKAGFNGPVMVECCARGQTAEEWTANARKNREFLEKMFAGL
jgi:sugar phosphate isomerase/epimerase